MFEVAILLCAGYGTRLGALGVDQPKPLLAVADRPLLSYLIDQLAGLELDHIHVVANARFAPAYRAWAATQEVAITVHDDGTATPAERLGAVGDLAFVLERIALPDLALVAAGDNIFRFDLALLWRTALRRGRSTLIALSESDLAELRRTGVLELGADDRVLRLHEKPQEPPSTWACPSLYALRGADLLQARPYLASGQPRDEIGRFIAALVDSSEVFAWRGTGTRLHVGSPAEFHAADRILRKEPIFGVEP
jgi:dTDP-glucose pyrophosphorylase